MAHTITIPGTHKTFGGDNIFFIAEIGKNFIQSEDERPVVEYLKNAIDLVDAAVVAGADAVKFQTHVREDEVLDIDFTSPHFTGSDRYSWVGLNEAITPLEGFWKPLKAHCDEQGILFFSTPMSRRAAQKLVQVGVSFWKVGSGDVQDYVLLDYLIERGGAIVISSGMVSLRELDEVIAYITGKGAPLVVLYCVSQYPCPPEMFNVSTIEYLTEKYPDVVIGFSDHSVTHDAVTGAMKLGAKVIEKHFSFSRDLWGSDHKASLTPEEFQEMVEIGRSGSYESCVVAQYYGEKEKELEGAENKFRPYFNKALVAGTGISAGETVTADMVYAMRPIMHAGGLPANRLHDIVGQKAIVDLAKYDPITESAVG